MKSSRKWFCLTCKNTKGGKRKQLKKVTLKQRTKAKMVCRNNPKNRDIREKYYNLYPKLFEQCGFVIQHHKGQNLSRRMIKPEKTPVRPAKTRDHPGHLPNLTSFRCALKAQCRQRRLIRLGECPG